ncbi:hypothetical protein ACI78V_02120 [Geodermatophilus sp. SYSU D00742]
MRFTVDGWDPSYGTSLELEDADLGASTARIDVDVERPAADWAPLDPPADQARPAAVLFVDGVRRVEARVWIDDVSAAGPATEASAAICASYAGGVVCCCKEGAHLLTVDARRGLFTIAAHAVDVTTYAGTYTACRTAPSEGMPLSVTLSSALQQRLAGVEMEVAVTARSQLAGHGVDGEDLLVIDGPLRGRQHLPRAIGFIKSHRAAYLPAELHSMVGALGPGQRTPVFLMGTSWDRHAWYLRLPCRPGAPWAGIVRVECSADLPAAEVVGLADLSQLTLCRYASDEYKDARAPQNLYPIAGLERELRRRLGDPRLLYRALRVAAA